MMSKLSEKVRTENLLMFIGMALMCTGPAFWYLMEEMLTRRTATLGPGTAATLDACIIGAALLMSLTGMAVALAGWSLSAWHAWQAVKIAGSTGENAKP